MSGSLSDYAELKVLEHIIGKNAFTMPANVYLALVTTLPTDGSVGSTLVEPSTSGTAYARLQILGSDWNSASAGAISNANTKSFPTATEAGWGTIVGWALVDASAVATGNVLVWGSVGTQKAVLAGDTVSFNGGTPGDIVITAD